MPMMLLMLNSHRSLSMSRLVMMTPMMMMMLLPVLLMMK